MNSATERKINEILLNLRNNASRSFEGEIGKFARRHGYRPDFVTVVTVREAVRAAQVNVLELLDRAVIEVSEVSKTVEAFGILRGAMFLHLSYLEGLVEQWNGMPLHPRNLSVADERFTAVRQDLIANVDGNRYRFKNTGGRPRELNWDGAKAHVKAKFPEGFKQYRGLQTEVAEVMSRWFRDRGRRASRSDLMKHAGKLIQEHQYPQKSGN